METPPTYGTPAGSPASLPTRRPRLSCTQVDMWRRCPQQYGFRYALGIKRPPSASFGFGLAFDDACNEEYRHKQQHGVDLPVSDMTDKFAACWDTRKKDVEFRQQYGEKPEVLLDEGTRLVPVFHKAVCQKVQPIAIQKEVLVVLEGVPFDFIGYVDLVDNEEGKRIVIADTKTTGGTWDKGREFRETQPVAYTMASQATENPSNEFRFDIAVKGQKPHVEQRRRVVRPEEQQGFLRLLGHIWAATRAGVFYPRDPDHWSCSKKWCGYWELCEKEWGFRVKE